MISRIGPLVQSGRQFQLVWLHLAGGLVGGLMIGLVAGYVGQIVSHVAPSVQQLALASVLPALLVWSALADLKLSPQLPLQTTRQTPGSWSCSLGRAPASFAWGLDLGTGVGTRMTTQAFIALLASTILVADVGVAMAIMGAYGLARSGAVVAAVSISAPAKLDATCNAILDRSQLVRVAVATASLFTAVILFAGA